MNLPEKEVVSLMDEQPASACCSPLELHTVIIGLGHPLRGDDGAGSAVVHALAQTQRLPKYVALLEGRTNELFDAILSNRYERVILIDAAEIGRAPGEWICFNADQATWDPKVRQEAGDGHRLGLWDVLALGQVLGLLPGGVTIYAVQPLWLGWTGNLSGSVGEAVLEISESILDEFNTESEN